MFSALKKLTRGSEERGGSAPTRMPTSLQKKFSRGVHYNMKILIKGDRNVGKSCLLQRLQGGAFIEEYAPTEEIQAAAIHWTYKETNHIVKVDVWEVVDKARSKRKPPPGLKLDNVTAEAVGGRGAEDDAPALDATFLDVYKDASGVILMFDITKPWTFDYVVKELNNIPADIPLVLLGNHCDMQHHRQLHSHHIESVLHQARQSRSAVVRYAESSMRNGFGLRFLHKFLSVPFLRLQRTTLLQQLQANQKDAVDVEQELNDFQNSEESDYLSFMERLASKRRAGAAVPPTVERSPSIVLGGGKPIVPPQVNPLMSMNLTSPVLVSPSQPEQTQYVNKQLLASKLHCNDNTLKLTAISGSPKVGVSGGELDEFYAGALDSSFLDEAPSPHVSAQHSYDSDSDKDTTNPMVACTQEELDELDFRPPSYADPTLPDKITNTPRKSENNSMRPDSASVRPDDVASFSLDGGDVESGEIRELDEIMSSMKIKGRGDAGASSEGFELWVTTARRSPEGGEDPDVSVEPPSIKEDKKNKKKKSKDKDGDSEKVEKKHKHKKSKKEKKQHSLLLSPEEETRTQKDYDSL